jgi:hypothetical protein
MTNILLSILIMFLAVQCRQDDAIPKEAKIGQEFTLQQGFQIVIRDDQSELLLILQDVQDSRCPKEVQCIQYGRASILLEFGNSNASSTLQMCLGECSNTIKNTDQAEQIIDGTPYKLTLLSVDPYPKADGKSPHKKIRMKVERR